MREKPLFDQQNGIIFAIESDGAEMPRAPTNLYVHGRKLEPGPAKAKPQASLTFIFLILASMAW